MQPTTLLENLNSDLLAAYSAMLPRGSAQQVLVYVESHEDIAFWRGILSPFEKKRISFDIQLPSHDTLKKGKLAVLEFADRVGRNLILCVDSDYDYLLQGTSETSALIIGNPHIFQTYSYSIENLKCYAEGLHLVCAQSTKSDTKIVDLDDLMQLYSSIVYKLFLWSVHFPLNNDTTSFTLTEFCDVIKVLNGVKVSDKFISVFEELRDKVALKIDELERKHPHIIGEVGLLEKSLEQLGVFPSNTYLFVQGHTIKDNVVLMFLRSIFDHLKREKENEIKTNAKHSDELKNQLNLYKSQTIPIDVALDMNTDFKTCHLYLKIESDITNYVEQFSNA